MDPEQFDDQHILDWCLDVIRWSRERHEKEYCEQAYSHYCCYKNWVDSRADPDDWTTNIGVGIAYPSVKIVSARLQAPWGAGDYMFTAHAMDAESSDRDEKIAGFINYSVVNVMPRMFSKTELCNESAIALGRGILASRIVARPSHKRLRRVVQQIQSMLGMQVGSTLSWEDVPIEKRHDFEYVDSFNFWWVGQRRFSNDCDFSVERDYLTTYEVYRRLDSGDFLPVEFDGSGGRGFDQYTAKRMGGSDLGGWRDNMTGGGNEPRVHSLFTLQGWVETGLKENGYPAYSPMRVQILDEQYLVKRELLDTYDSKPGYIVVEPYQDIGANRPIGMIETIEQLLYAINDILSIGMDNQRKALESPLAVDPSSVQSLDARGILFGPREVNWITNPRQNMADFPTKELGPGFDKIVTILLDLVQRNSGVSDAFGGANTEQSSKYSPGMKTARGFEMMTNLAASRIAPIVQKMDLEMYRVMAKTVHQTALLYLPSQVPVRLQKNPLSPFTMVGPDDLDAQVEYAFNTKALDAALGSRRQEFQEMMAQIMELAGTGQLGMQGKYLDAAELVQVLGAQYGFSAEVAQLVKDIPMEQLPMALPGMQGAGMPPVVPGSPMPSKGMPGPGGMAAPGSSGGPPKARPSGIGQSKVA